MKFEDCMREKKLENIDKNFLTISSLNAGIIFNLERS